MTNIDQLKDLELIAAFARALGYSLESKDAIDAFEPHMSNLIIQEFDRIKPDVKWFQGTCSVRNYIPFGNITSANGPDFKTAVARLVVKLEEEKA